MADVGSIGVESRFAVLNKKKKKPKKPETSTTVNGIKSNVGAKATQQQNTPKKKPPTQPPLVGLPGNHIPEDPEEKKKRKKKKKIPNQTSQWDEWRLKDEENADKELHRSIQQALALSKLEARRRLMVPAVICTSEKPKETPASDMMQDASLTNGGNQLKSKKKDSPKLLDDLIDNQITSEKFKSLLAAKDEEIVSLKETVEKLTAEMKQIRLRNKSLCTIISEGEIKSKAELILELESSLKMKDELLAEVNRLNTHLEQERSKVTGLSQGSDKTRNKKNRLKSESEK